MFAREHQSVVGLDGFVKVKTGGNLKIGLEGVLYWFCFQKRFCQGHLSLFSAECQRHITVKECFLEYYAMTMIVEAQIDMFPFRKISHRHHGECVDGFDGEHGGNCAED